MGLGSTVWGDEIEVEAYQLLSHHEWAERARQRIALPVQGAIIGEGNVAEFSPTA